MFGFNKFKTTERVFIIFLIIIPFLKGLFFKEVFLSVFIFFGLLLLIVGLKSKVFWYDNKALILFMLQFIIGIFSVLFCIHTEEAIYGVIQILAPFLVYLLLINMGHSYLERDLTENLSVEKRVNGEVNKLGANIKTGFSLVIYKALFIMFLSGTLISVVNFLVELLFNSTNELIRFVWVIPYANTLAVYLFACSISGLYILEAEKSGLIKRVLIITAICMNITAFVFTYSRAMLVIGLLFYGFFLILQKSRRLFIDFTVIIILTLLCVFLYSTFKWNSFVPIFLLCALLALLFEKVRNQIDLSTGAFIKAIIKKRKLLIVFMTTFAAMLIALVLIFKATALYERINTININEQSLQERFAYYRDAIRIINDFPIFGLGSGGWASIQFKYQTALYFPKYVHSSVFQTLLDFGLSGFLIALLQVLIFIKYSLSALKRITYENRLQVICLITINSVILIHSVLDLDFQFPLISLLFWMNVAFLFLLSGEPIKKLQLRRGVKGISTFALIVAIIVSISFDISYQYYLKGMKSFDSERYAESEKLFSEAVYFNPFSSDSFFMKGCTLAEQYKLNGDNKLFIESIKSFQNAQQYDRYNPRYFKRAGNTCYIAQDFDNSVKDYRTLIDLQPLEISNYVEYSDALLQKAETRLNLGKVKDARVCFEELKDIEEKLNRTKEKLSTSAFKLKHRPVLTITSRLAYNMCVAFYNLSDINKARQYLKIAEEDKSYIPLTDELRSKFERYN